MFSESQIKARLEESGKTSCLLGRSAITFEDLGKAALYKDPAAIHTLQKMSRDTGARAQQPDLHREPRADHFGGERQHLGTLLLEEVQHSLRDCGIAKNGGFSGVRFPASERRLLKRCHEILFRHLLFLPGTQAACFLYRLKYACSLFGQVCTPRKNEFICALCLFVICLK